MLHNVQAVAEDCREEGKSVVLLSGFKLLGDVIVGLRSGTVTSYKVLECDFSCVEIDRSSAAILFRLSVN
jgi:hypothetical protein